MTVDSLEVWNMNLLDAASLPPPSPPPPRDGGSPLLFIGVLSAPGNKELRDGQRASWLQHPSVAQGQVVAKFFVGRDAAYDQAVAAEGAELGDIVVVDKEEGYYNIAFKSLEIQVYGSRVAPYTLKVDDDTYVQVDKVVPYVQGLPESTMVGWINCDGEPHRTEGTAWYMSPEDYAPDTYPPFPHGSAYIASRDIGETLRKLRDANQLKVWRLEDVSMGLWIRQVKEASGLPVSVINDQKFLFHDKDCREEAYTVHKLTAEEQKCMWRKAEAGDANRCCTSVNGGG